LLTGVGTDVAVPDMDLAESVALAGDKTRVRVSWKGGGDNISKLRGKAFRVAFLLSEGHDTQQLQLFSLWVAETGCGESSGYVAGGDSRFNASRDMVGSCDPE
jgi:hypothetical protein